jgi:hypothetical protein
MKKIDLKKQDKELYNPSTRAFALLEVPPMHFLMIDGQGDPNTSQAFQEAVDALYGVAYTLKFASKKAGELDWVVQPLEGLWWTGDMEPFTPEDKGAWRWTLMIRQPDHLTEAMVQAAMEEVKVKKDPPALPKLRFETFHEGLSVQIMHIGPYAEEAPTIAKMHAFIQEQGYAPRGKHHEIYLSDPNRTAPERLKTVLRQPIQASE